MFSKVLSEQVYTFAGAGRRLLEGKNAESLEMWTAVDDENETADENDTRAQAEGAAAARRQLACW